MKKLFTLFALLVLVACTRVETGEVGLHKGFDGQVSLDAVGQGFHQTLIGDVLVFSAREVLVPIKGLKPATKDKLPMEDVDVRFAYSVNPSSVGKLYTKYSASYNVTEGGEIFLLQAFVESLVQSSVNDAISKYAALEVNDKRVEIQEAIQADVASKVHAEGLDGDVRVGQIVLTTLQIPRSITESTQLVVQQQNAARAAEFEAQKKVAQARGEADSAVIAAQGQAKAITAQIAAIQQQGADAYLAAKAIEKWNGELPPQYASTPLPFIGNVAKQVK